VSQRARDTLFKIAFPLHLRVQAVVSLPPPMRGLGIVVGLVAGSGTGAGFTAVFKTILE
jgi:hypothetical protein